MASPLGYVYSRADALKRRLYDMITNPVDYASMLGGRIQEGAANRESMMNQAFGDPNNPLKVTNPQALAQLTDMIMSGELGFAPAGITAYHGSPYLFSKFDPAKAGTGEGAQAYGVGAGYTSEARGIAEKYSPRDPAYEDHLQKLYKQAEKKQDYDSMDVLESAMMHKRPAELRSQYGEAAEPVIKKIEQFMPKSYLYKGDIPDEILPKFLDWDKPIKDQPEILKSITPNSLGLTYTKLPNGKHAFLTSDGKPLGILQTGGTKESFESNWTKDLVSKKGSDLYGNLSQSIPSGGEKASEALSIAGVRGIRYTDVSDNKLVSNFVPFSPEDFKIQEINDMPIQDWISKGLLAP